MEGEEWLGDSVAAIGEALAGCDRPGAIGGTIPLFTDDPELARKRAAQLSAAHAALPGARGRVLGDRLERDPAEESAQYRVLFRLR